MKLKIGFDVHGVADENVEFFREFSMALIKAGHEVHIITGPHEHVAMPEIEALGIPYTHFFSMCDHHARIGTEITYDYLGRPFMDEYLWDKTKAEYCVREGIHLHLDDSDAYGYFFKTPYARYYSKNKRSHYVKDENRSAESGSKE